MTPQRLHLRACAKVNLALEVLGRRSDGYHEIRTVLQTISVHDDLYFASNDQPGGQPALRVDGRPAWQVPAGDDNLVALASRAYAAAVARTRNYLRRAACSARSEQATRFSEIRLMKRIPPAAGLGGGSSDAAATLRALDCANPTPLGPATLRSVAVSIGSDVPFFLGGGTQLASGRGELLQPLPDIDRRWLVLITPPLATEQKTARLFGMLRPADFSDGSGAEAVAAALRGSRSVTSQRPINTFERVADAAFDGLAVYRQALQHTCGQAMLSGSGPSLFALMESEGAARSAVKQLQGQGISADVAYTVTSDESILPILDDGELR